MHFAAFSQKENDLKHQYKPSFDLIEILQRFLLQYLKTTTFLILFSWICNQLQILLSVIEYYLIITLK